MSTYSINGSRFFFSFPFNIATFGKEDYVSEYRTNRPCLLAF